LLESKAVERGISERTRESHLQSLSDFQSFVANNNLSLTKETARDYISSCYERALKALSIMNRTSALGGFFKFLPRDRVISVDLMQGIEPPAQERRLPGLQGASLRLRARTTGAVYLLLGWHCSLCHCSQRYSLTPVRLQNKNVPGLE
jgi:site-specific recombinase XerC